MITFRHASLLDSIEIESIARTTWPITYGSILSSEQLEYMLQLIYSQKALHDQISRNKQHFYFIQKNQVTQGFFAIEHNYNQQNCTRIHKLYLLPISQGLGIGRKAIDFISSIALENSSERLSLNVNRFNSALNFYKNVGFETVQEVNIEIGNGYLMEDYVMEKLLL